MVKVRFKEPVHGDAGLGIYDAGKEYDVPEELAERLASKVEVVDDADTKTKDVGGERQARTTARETPGSKR